MGQIKNIKLHIVTDIKIKMNTKQFIIVLLFSLLLLLQLESSASESFPSPYWTNTYRAPRRRSVRIRQSFNRLVRSQRYRTYRRRRFSSGDVSKEEKDTPKQSVTDW